jgi:hypothetical protein
VVSFLVPVDRAHRERFGLVACFFGGRVERWKLV